MSDKEPPSRVPGTGAGCGPSEQDVARLAERLRSRSSALRRYGPLLLIAAAMALVLGMGWHREVTLDNIVLIRHRFQHVLAAHQGLALLLYCLAYIAMTALSLPGGLVLTVAGGLLFGCWLGGVATVLSATAGATLLFLVARGALGETFVARAGPWLARLREGFQADAMSYLLFLRLVPAFPFWFVNIAPAVLGVPLKTFVLGTVIGIVPATFAFASAGAGLDSVIMAAKDAHTACVAAKGVEACPFKLHVSSLLTRELMLALALVGLVALMPIGLKKWKRRSNDHAAAK
jgi:uncharacterized membrane protein YdjX (TVP38/TMEM64 family)